MNRKKWIIAGTLFAIVAGFFVLREDTSDPQYRNLLAKEAKKKQVAALSSSKQALEQAEVREQVSQSDSADFVKKAIPELEEFTWRTTRVWNLPLNNPPITSRADAFFMKPDDTVIGLLVDGRARAYPWYVLANYHAVNDHIAGRPIIVNLCEACNGAGAFFANVATTTLDFRPKGVKNGTWYAVDFQTESHWFPFSGEAFEGPLAGTKLERIPCYFSTWREWSDDHPNTTVVQSNDEVRRRDHGAISHMANTENFNPSLLKRIMDPAPNPRRDWLQTYDLVFGFVPGKDDSAIAYPINVLNQSDEPIQTQINGEPTVILLQKKYQVSAFIRKLDGVELKLKVTSKDPFLMTDQLGNDWDVWGRIVSGPNHPAKMDAADGYLTKWYEWIENYPTSQLFPDHLDDVAASPANQGLQTQKVTHNVSADNTDVTLGEDQQRLIWDLEHSTFELEWKFGEIVKKAIRERDSKSLRNCFLPNASGTLLAVNENDVDQDRWWHQEATAHGDEDGFIPAESADDLVHYLMQETSRFTEISGMSLRVLHIHPDMQVENQYLLNVLLTAKGKDANGVASLYSKHDLVVHYKNDQDIIDGQIVRKWDVKSMAFHGAKKPFFVDATSDYGLDRVRLPDNWKLAEGDQIDSYTSQMAVADYDNDGYLDIAVSTIQGAQVLLRSIEGKRFEDVTEKVGLPKGRFFSFTTFSTWIDYDNDGFQDLLIGRNLYHNEQGKRFTLATYSAELKFRAASMGAVVADFDCDGWLDLYVLNHMGDEKEMKGFVTDNSTAGVPNQLWRNLGNGSFEDVTSKAGVDGAARHSFSASWFFANEDRYPDLYVVNDFGRNCLFINQGNGTFQDVTESAGVGDFANSMGIATGDIDNDGTTEIYVANMFSKMGRRIIDHVSESDYPDGVYKGIQGSCAGSHLYKLTEGNHQYKEISVDKHVNAVGWAFAPVFSDFDADGLLDIYAASGFISTNRRKPDG